VFVVAPSCYDLWFPREIDALLDFEMLMRRFASEGKLTDRLDRQPDIDN
jgi:hypothetical protein